MQKRASVSLPISERQYASRATIRAMIALRATSAEAGCRVHKPAGGPAVSFVLPFVRETQNKFETWHLIDRQVDEVVR
jgi:hypothetical protein